MNDVKLTLRYIPGQYEAAVKAAAARKISEGSRGLKVIYSQRLAGYLMERGFVLVRSEPDKRGTGRKVFLFRKSDELEAAISEYVAQR